MAASREKVMSSTTQALKKIRAGGGKLQGNFYFVSGMSSDEDDPGVVLATTLSARDKKGAVAMSLGKPFRKSYRSAKYALGSVTINTKKRVVFTFAKGNAKVKDIRDALRKTISEEPGLGFLKRALVVNKSDSSDVMEEVELTEEETQRAEADDEALGDITNLDGISEAEMRELYAAQDEISNLDTLLQSFLDEDEDAVLKAQQDEIQAQLSALSELDPTSTQAQAAREKLAEALAVGEALDMDVGVELSEELTVLMNSVINDQPDPAALIQKYNEAGQLYILKQEPEAATALMKQASVLFKSEDWKALGAVLDDELLPALKRIGRNEEDLTPAQKRAQEVSDELEQLGGDQVNFGKIAVAVRKSYSEASRALNNFKKTAEAFVKDKLKGQDDSSAYSDLDQKVATMDTLLPQLSQGLDDALNAITTSKNADDRRDNKIAARKLVAQYLSDLEEHEVELSAINKGGPLGSAEVYDSLHKALDTLHDYLEDVQ